MAAAVPVAELLFTEPLVPESVLAEPFAEPESDPLPLDDDVLEDEVLEDEVLEVLPRPLPFDERESVR